MIPISFSRTLFFETINLEGKAGGTYLLIIPIQDECVGRPGRILGKFGSCRGFSLGPYDFGRERSLPLIVDRDLLGEMGLEKAAIRVIFGIRNKDWDVAGGHQVDPARALPKEVEALCG